jgi:hypothetical protein
MKYGGIGYAPPEEGSFPPLEEVVAMTLDCGGVPSACWLDGTSAGEADPLEHFAFLRGKGIPTVTIIPDRNWNIKDPADKALKVRNFRDALRAAARLDMPVLVGTEMNKHGANFVDTFSAAEMEPHRQAFLDGARVAWGHTLLRLTAGVGYVGDWADSHFGAERARRNSFFRDVGSPPYPDEAVLWQLAAADGRAAPEALLGILGR